MKTSEQERRILDRVTPRFATRRDAQAWYRAEPIVGFGGLTAQRLVRMGRGIEVLNYLDASDAGVHA